MNKLAFYGYIDFFKEKRSELDEYENNDNFDLVISIINGCYRNNKFSEYCSDIKIMQYRKDLINGFLIANNSYKAIEHTNLFIYYDFNYPDHEHAILGNKQINCLYDNTEQFIFLCVLNDWRETYNKQIFKKRNDIAYSLALYLNKEFYIKHQETLINDDKEIDKDVYHHNQVNDGYFFRHLNTNIRYENCNLYPPGPWTSYDSDIEYFNESDYIDENDRSHIENVTKYDIVNNFDIAYKLYLNGDRSNIVLSKIVNTDPYKFRDIYKKYNPFLLFTRNEVDLNVFTSSNPLVKYNLSYIRIITSATVGDSLPTRYIDIPEYNLYVIAIKLRKKNTIDKILELYKKFGKLFKIMDLEKECYIDPPEEIYELPNVKNIDIFTGDELNPYINLKLT